MSSAPEKEGVPSPRRKSFSPQPPNRAADVALREAGGWRLSRQPRRGSSGNTSPKKISAGLALASRLCRTTPQLAGRFLICPTWMGGLRLQKGRSSPPPGKPLVFSCRALPGKGAEEEKPLSPVPESLNSFPKGSLIALRLPRVPAFKHLLPKAPLAQGAVSSASSRASPLPGERL